MRHLITGSAGFIGSNLTRELLSRNEEVVGIDCFTDYYSRSQKENNLKDVLHDENFTFIEEDLMDIDLVKILSDVDYVYHQAAQAGVRNSWGDSFEVYSNNNILATQKLLEAAKDTDIKKFIYASSSSVYGDTDQLPMKEDNPVHPVSPYGVSKLAGENLCYLYWKNYKVPTISLRYFTVFGEGQRPDMAFHIFIEGILKRQEINIYGDGNQSRNFTHVKDILAANIIAAESDVEGEVFNIGGDGEGIILNNVIRLMEEEIGEKAMIRYSSEVRGDVRHTSADCSKAKIMLCYKPKTSFREGLREEISWLKKVYDYDKNIIQI